MNIVLLFAFVPLAMAAPLEETSDMFRGRMEMLRSLETTKSQGSHSAQFPRASAQLPQQNGPLASGPQYNGNDAFRKEMANEVSGLKRPQFKANALSNPELMANGNADALTQRAGQLESEGPIRQNFGSENFNERSRPSVFNTAYEQNLGQESDSRTQFHVLANPEFVAQTSVGVQTLPSGFTGPQQPIVAGFSPFLMEDCLIYSDLPIIPVPPHPLNNPIPFLF